MYGAVKNEFSHSSYNSEGISERNPPRRRQWHPTPVLLPEKSHGQRSLVGYSPSGHEESDTTERIHFHFSLSCIGEGNGNPLQCSCLENPKDRGAWWAAVYGVAQSWTRLKRCSSRSNPPKPRVMCSGHPEVLCDMNTCHLCCRVQGHWSHPPAQGRTSHLSSHRRSLSSWQRPSEAALHG